MKGKIENNVRLLAIVSVILFFISLHPLKAQRMTEHLWENRVLLLFSPNEESKIFQTQLQEFIISEEKMIDRDLLLYQVFNNSGTTPSGEQLAKEKLMSWRKKWQVEPEGFLLVLIGKDGGTKYKSPEKTDPSVIFDLIDSMPMRRAEMKNKSHR